MKKLLVVVLALAMVISLAACGGSSSGSATKQEEVKFPERDITIIVPYAAGGSSDLLCRAIATQVSQDLGVNVVVTNVTGGGGTTGTSQAVNSAPDGYTLAFPSNGGFLINPAVNEVGYTYKTATPICIATEVNIAIAVRADSPYQTFADLLAETKPLTFSSPGANSTPHLLAAGIAADNDKTWNHSPNGSTPQMAAELIGGHIDFISLNIPSVSMYVNEGQVRALAVTGDQRDPALPDVPTLKELGYEFPATVYFCLVGPANMDEAVVKILSDAFGNAIANPAVTETMEKLNQPPVFVDYKAFAERAEKDYEFYEGILKDMGIL